MFFRIGVSECCLNYSVEKARMCLNRDLGFNEEMEIKPRAWVLVDSPSGGGGFIV